MSKIHTHARRFAALAAVALLAAVAAGCGSSSKSSDASTKANATDRAFVKQMIPHHEMAIEMARSAKNEGQHPQIKTLADQIITAQMREIAEMTPIAKRLGATPEKMSMDMGEDMGAGMEGDAKALNLTPDQMGMSMDMSSLEGAKPFDRAFVDMMIPHHQGAIRMARAELAAGRDPQLQKIAKAIVGEQADEIAKMNAWRSAWYGKPSPAGGVPQA